MPVWTVMGYVDMWLIALLIALGSAFVYTKLAKIVTEVAIVCIPITLIGLVVMLVVAPSSSIDTVDRYTRFKITLATKCSVSDWLRSLGFKYAKR